MNLPNTDAMFKRQIPFKSVRTQIVVFFAALIVVVQIVSLILVYAANMGNAHRKVSQDLKLGERIFLRLLNQNSQKLAQAASILSLDFAFRESVATRDLETIRSVLANHGSRIGADLMVLVSLDNQIIADTSDHARPGDPFSFIWLTEEAVRNGRATGLVMIEGHAYQLAVVPVLAPTPIAWAVFAFAVDDRLAGDLKNLLALDVSFLAHATGEPWQMLASTVSASLQGPMKQMISETALEGERQEGALKSAGDEYETLMLPLERRGAMTIAAVLQRSLDEALDPFRRLSKMLLSLAVGSLILSIAGGILIARGVTRRISMLAELTKRIAKGDYAHRVNVPGKDEIAELASRFDMMREGIAAREEEISRLAYRDGLTDLPNRVVFNDRLNLAVEVTRRSKVPLTVLLMDLDRFKNINDTLGHQMGDQVLQQVARRLSALLRTSDTAARLGGDEFAILLIDTSIDSARRIVAKIIAVLEEPILIGQYALDIRASIGAASCPEHSDDADTLMRYADAAMYAAKRANAGFTVYDPHIHQQREIHLSLLSELRRAIDGNELKLVFQPKVDLKTGMVTGLEALIRWVHPERGLVPPVDFIPFAEQTGFIKSITRWVIEAAVQHTAEWHRAGRQIKVSVNLSVQDLLNPELMNIITNSLRKHSLPAQLLCVEITESGVMQDAGHSIEILKRIQGLGVARSIDDFGTGYSSLAYVKQLTVDEIKIDSSFVRNIVNDNKDRTIVLSMIGLGHSLGLSVVAEGVEDNQTAELLRDLGCDEAQGYFYAKPMESFLVMDWIAAKEKAAIVGAKTEFAIN